MNSVSNNFGLWSMFGLLLLSLNIMIVFSSKSESESDSDSDSSEGVSLLRKETISGDFCHGTNIQYGDCITDYSNPNLELTDIGRDFWANLCLEEIDLVSGNQIVEGLDEENEYISTYLTDDSAEFLISREFWNSVMSEEEQGYNHILDNPSIFLGSNWFGEGLPSVRSSLPSYQDMIDDPTNNPKYTAYRSEGISSQGNYSLADWNKATGTLKFKCYDDGTGDFTLSAKRLIPYMPYTIWAVWGISSYNGTGSDSLPIEAASATAFSLLGGTPTGFFADKNGKSGEITRKLPYCPLDSEDPMMYVALAAHWDFVIAGASYYSDRPAGTAAAEHLCFSVADYI